MRIEKEKIKESLQAYCERYGSQNKAALSLTGVSSATVSQVLNNNWELVNDKMWMNIASQIGFKTDDWVVVETRDFKVMTELLNDSKQFHIVNAITGEAGTGKTEAIKNFVASNKNAFVLNCNEYWNRKLFLVELLQQMGRDASGFTVGELMNEIVRGLKTTQNPVIIMDEADKLTDQVLYFFITLYNQLEDHCGIMLCATDNLEKRIRKGLRLNKKGYKEIFSRIGRKFIVLRGVSSVDIQAICIANGIDDKKEISRIMQESENDLRRVKKMIHASKRSS
jgi:DNA transposition AAA+ family ATPase